MTSEKYEHLLCHDEMSMTDGLFKYIIDKWYAGREVSLPKKIHYPFGTVEWSDETYNSHQGCKNNCTNCYARNLAWQKKFSYWKNYDNMVIDRKPKWIKGWKVKPDGFWFMYPSMHDTFEETVDDAIKVMENMLKANGNILFVTKPRYKVIKQIIDTFSNHALSAFEEPKNYLQGQPHIKFRFSISTNDDIAMRIWEPSAPNYKERKESLIMAHERGCDVGVSAEPFFPTVKPEGVDEIHSFIEWVRSLLPYVTDTFWVGMMNYIPQEREDGFFYLRGNKLSKEMVREFRNLEEFYAFKNIFRIVTDLKDEPKLRWKESIKKVYIDYIRRHNVYNDQM